MADAARRNEILAYLKEKKKASVEELAHTLFVSEATIRRDLTEMQKLGLIERSHGGALLVEGSDEISIFIRQAKNAREKMQAVTVALRHIPEFQAAFIDNSSTCLALSERMNFSYKTVVTNGIQIALRVARHDNVNLIVPGGVIKYNSTAMIGGMALNQLRDFRFDVALLSCSAVSADGSFEIALDSMQIKKLVMENSKQKILLFDATKINKTFAFRTAPLESYDALITNAPDEMLEELRAIHPHVYNR